MGEKARERVRARETGRESEIKIERERERINKSNRFCRTRVQAYQRKVHASKDKLSHAPGVDLI